MRHPNDDTWLSPDQMVRELGWKMPRRNMVARSYDSICDQAALTYWIARAKRLRQQGDTAA